MDRIAEIIRQTRAYYCLDCGKCTGNCPVALHDETFSPRALVRTVLLGEGEELAQSRALWSCLACRMCQERCPSDVQYIDFQRKIRAVYKDIGHREFCSHGGAFQALMRIMTAPRLRQNRLGWVTGDLAISTKSETLYFVGCLPYFDVLFADLGVCTLDTARSTVKILNALGIRPRLLENERCCGHDLLWTGDEEHFLRLARHNVREIEKRRIKRVIFSCPEGYRTFKRDYPEFLGSLKFEVLHLSELLADASLPAGSLDLAVTYQDPCRLGRHMGIYQQPREVITSIQGLDLREMYHHGHTAMCCGTSAWMNCDRASKGIQMERLKEARGTGADVLVTACPKCQIHLTCAMKDQHLGGSLNMEIRDFATVVAEALFAPKKGKN
jgi:heterodisulfide reductase subunit D